jgi:hypothetical protein
MAIQRRTELGSGIKSRQRCPIWLSTASVARSIRIEYAGAFYHVMARESAGGPAISAPKQPRRQGIGAMRLKASPPQEPSYSPNA